MKRTRATMNPSTILFYSPRCRYCVSCLEQLEPFANKINFLGYVDIHTVPPESIPDLIKRVPTLVLNNGETVYEGKEVFDWIHRLTNIIGSEQKAHAAQATAEPKSAVEASPMQQIQTMSVAISDMRTTLTDGIDYTKVRIVEPELTKSSFSPESVLEKRNTELDAMRAKLNGFGN